jgi:hypothetical protein
MKKLFPLYYLYCINKQCSVSIYYGITELEILFTAENLKATYICTCCNKPLVSAMDFKFRDNSKYQDRTLECVQLINNMEENGTEKKGLPGVLFISTNEPEDIKRKITDQTKLSGYSKSLIFETITYNLN